MSLKIALIARVAVFAALVFAGSFAAAWLPNVNPCFFIVFAAGFVWGAWAGVLVGLIGYLLWALLNPYGPSPPFLLISQLAGISISGIIGAVSSKLLKPLNWNKKTAIIMILAGLSSGLGYHIIVDSVDALLFQPFWPRLIGGMVFSLITIAANSIMFPLLYPALAFVVNREKGRE